MKQQQQWTGTPRLRMMIFVSRKVDWTIRNLASKRHQSISKVAHEMITKGLKSEGFLKDGE